MHGAATVFLVLLLLAQTALGCAAACVHLDPDGPVPEAQSAVSLVGLKVVRGNVDGHVLDAPVANSALRSDAQTDADHGGQPGHRVNHSHHCPLCALLGPTPKLFASAPNQIFAGAYTFSLIAHAGDTADRPPRRPIAS